MWWTTKECPVCKGRRIKRAWPYFWRTRTCPKCHGRGRISIPLTDRLSLRKDKPIARAEKAVEEQPEAWIPIPVTPGSGNPSGGGSSSGSSGSSD